MRILLPALVLTLSWIASCASTNELTVELDGPPLRVASDLKNPPFADMTAGGEAVGRDVEMMEELGRALGRPIEWVRMPFRELMPSLEAGEVDVICATFGVTPERAQRVAYTRPYFGTAIAIVCRTGDGEPSSKGELDGRRVSAAITTTSERAVRQRLPRAVGVFENKDETPTDERLFSGEIDAAVMDGPAADTLVASSAGRLVRLEDTLGAELYALAVSLGRDELLAELNEAIEFMEESGRMLELDERFALESAR